MKDIIFLGTSVNDIREFPVKARREAGHQLNKVQCGDEPSDWKPMTTVGPGVREIRVKVGLQYRIIYVAHLDDCVYVLHAFLKKTQKTPKRDLDLAKERLKQIK